MRKKEMIRRPAIKAGMGNWTYYISTLTYKQLADYVFLPDEVYDNKDDSQRVQRHIDEPHVEGIKTYLLNEGDRFFDAIVLAVKGGNPKWYPGVFEKDGQSFYSVGIVELSGNEGIFPIDGQHRLMAIKEIAESIDPNAQEEIPVIMITHGEKDKDVEKMRRLFTSLNRYAKPINPSDFIALDEDDISAIATRYLADNMECFKNRILYSKTESMSRSDKDHFINIISFYKCNDYLLDSKGKNKADYKKFRPAQKDIEAFQVKLKAFWEALIAVNPDVNAFFVTGDASEQRGIDGGSVFFRPRGIDPYVEAVAFIHKKRPQIQYEDIMKKLAHYDMRLNSVLWKDVLWNGEVLTPGQALMRDVFIMLYDDNLLSKKRRKTVMQKLCEKKNISVKKLRQIMEDKKANETAVQ